MRRAIAIVLSAILVTTPIKVVLAQADQQESQVTATDIPSVVPPRTDQTPTRIGVPVVEPDSDAALLFTLGLALDANTRSWDAFGNPTPISTGGTIAIVVGAVLVVAAVVIAVIVSNINTN